MIHDPRRIGLLNLIVNAKDITRESYICNIFLNPPRPAIRQVFKETLLQLRNFYIMYYDEYRSSYPRLAGCSSMPLATSAGRFIPLGPDPRPIKGDFSRGLARQVKPLLEAIRGYRRLYEICLPDKPTEANHGVLLSCSPFIKSQEDL
jgi:hypothetical protein